MMDKKKVIQTVQRYLRGEDIDRSLIRKYAKNLYDERMFSYARRTFARLHREFPQDNRILRLWAISTYKDDDQPGESRFDEAAILISSPYLSKELAQKNTSFEGWENDIVPPQEVSLSEDAGILGSIFKQKWRANNQEKWLAKSLEYYHRGYVLWGKSCDAEAKLTPTEKQKADYRQDENYGDRCYCALNTAYLCDTLAKRQYTTGSNEILAQLFNDLRGKAKSIRDEIVAYCDKNEAEIREKWTDIEERRKAEIENEDLDTAAKLAEDTVKVRQELYWFYCTWAESLVCLNLPAAIDKMEEAILWSDMGSWPRDSTAQQLAAWREEKLFQDPEHEKMTNQILQLVLGEMPKSSRGQRLGIALSGGGFRAALFHIGVLARLAEQDLLRNIEVISCVSGGSILGAFYYLKVRNLLQTHTDEEITRGHYIQIVREIQDEFLSGINEDLRSNLFRHFESNVKMAVSPNYSRSSRIADLYEKYLYAQLMDKTESHDPYIYMQDLLIRPKAPNGELVGINPKRDNWKRTNKVPMLVLNATALNTGHCFQFTATWMGEPPGYINSEIDALPTLRRMYYDQAPAPHNKIRLATAVAASSCVPGLFAPVELRNLYRLKNGQAINLELVDGGVHDNQGINTLLEQECTSIIISDASGQLSSVNEPKSGIFGVVGRTNALLQERIRAAQLNDLDARFNSELVKGYLLMHLTKGLPSEVVDWHPCDDPYEPNITSMDQNGDDVLTPYGIRKNIQRALARIRTDLDSFHQSEAYMLMYSGYMMTDKELETGEGIRKHNTFQRSTTEHAIPAETWKFFHIKTEHDDPFRSEKLLKILMISEKMIKIHQVSSSIKFVIYLIGTLLLLTGLFLAWQTGYFTWFISGFTALFVAYFLFIRLRVNPFSVLILFVLGIFLSPLTWLFSAMLNKAYIRAGKVKGPTESPT
jgi:predicted acylesterase/phospholipase RssA